jgi:hypothetical protein
MKDVLRALAFVATLYALTYVVDGHGAEIRALLMHVGIVILIDVLISTVRFVRPPDKS